MEQFCQSCGMPLSKEVLGTNEDDTKNEMYYSYCFEKGKFKDHMKVEEMAALCAKFIKEEQPDVNLEVIEKENLDYLKTLKRWTFE